MTNFNRGMSCLVAMMMVCCTIGAARAAVYTVGDSSGWTIPGDSGDYGTWTSDKTFAVGDTLVFNYFPGHTVDEVSESDYKSCATGNAITSDSSGATTITLTAGAHYFICNIPRHCVGGMKLSVSVAAASSSGGGGTSTSTPGTTTSPAPGTTLTPPTTAVRNNPAATISSSNALSPVVAAIFTLCIVMIQSFVF